MKTFLLTAFFLILSVQTLAHQSISYDKWFEEAISRCEVNPSTVPDLTLNEFSFLMSTRRIEDLMVWAYNTNKRLPEFAHFDAEKNSFVAKLPYSDQVTLSSFFLYGVKLQIESALKRGLADYISIVDMGTARFYVPLEKWDSISSEHPSFAKSRVKIYEKIMSDRDTKTFYPTAMMFDLTSEQKDDHLMWRFVNRNLIVNNYSDDFSVLYNLEDHYNTLWEIEGYKLITAGFSISANKDGCFSFMNNGKKMYFDFSFSDPQYVPDPKVDFY